MHVIKPDPSQATTNSDWAHLKMTQAYSDILYFSLGKSD